MSDHEPLANVIAKGVFQLLQNKWLLAVALIMFLVWMGWGGDEIGSTARDIGDAVKDAVPDI